MYFLHVDKAVLEKNRKELRSDPAAVVQINRAGGHVHARTVDILGPSRLMHDETNPLPCGARAWIETEGPLKIDGKHVSDQRIFGLKPKDIVRCCGSK